MNDEPREASARTDASPPGPPIRRRPRTRRAVYTSPRHGVRLMLSLLFFALLAVGALYYVYTERILAKAPYAVLVDGAPVAVLRSQAEAMRAVGALRAGFVPALPAVVVFEEGEPALQPYSGLPAYLDEAEAVAALRKRVTPVLDGYAIFVNRQPRVLLASERAAWEAVSLMQERGRGKKPGLPTFRERVAIDHLRITLEKAKAQGIVPASPDLAAATLVRPPRKRVHIVERGDNFWKIGNENGLTVKQLIALNPTVDYKALHAGDVVKLPDEPSPVTVVVHAVVTPRTATRRTPAPTVVSPPAYASSSAVQQAPTVTPAPAPPSAPAAVTP